MNNIVSCEKLSKSFVVAGGEPLVVLKDIDWEMPSGKLVAICGQSGCGKSTFMNILGLLDRQTSGTLTIDGTIFDTSRDNKHLAEYRATKIGFIFQSHHLLPELTAIENVMTPQLIRGVDKKKARGEAEDILELIFTQEEIDSNVFNRYPGKMSGGQCQRVAIARALIGKPPLILADEPTGNLDEKSANQVFELFVNLQRELQISVIMVTHNPQQAKCADVQYRLYHGKLELEH